MMDKDEAVQKLATAGRLSIAHAEDLYDSLFPKPVVPQCVADWYEEHKERFDFYLSEFLCDWYGEDHNDNSPFSVWFGENWDAIQTLIDMHRHGYTVEKEPRYTVRVKGVSKDTRFLKRSDKGIWYFGNNDIQHGILPHTRKELENANFGWVFDCPGVEVKEVE